jgi:Type III restriction enzyme, res subunit
MNDLWPHQTKAIRDVSQAFAEGHRRVCLRMATGAGKSRVACELIRDWLMCGMKVHLYTERTFVFADLLCHMSLTSADRSFSNILNYCVPDWDDFQVGGLKKRQPVPYADAIVSDGWNSVSQDVFSRHAERPNARWLVLTAKMVKAFFYDTVLEHGTSEQVRSCIGTKLWIDFYNRIVDRTLTFTAAFVQFSIDYGFDPPEGSPFMPTTEWDMMRRVKDVPRERLT